MQLIIKIYDREELNRFRFAMLLLMQKMGIVPKDFAGTENGKFFQVRYEC